MRKVAFTDAEGETGYIANTLEFEYRGKWGKDVEACIERIKHKESVNSKTPSERDFYNNLMIELYDEARIVKVKKIDEPSTYSEPQ